MTVYLRKKKIVMADALNEMASDKDTYENKLSGSSMQLYQHLIIKNSVMKIQELDYYLLLIEKKY